MGFERGAVEKNMALKREGVKRKIVGLNGGHANNPQECQKPAFLTFRKFKFPRGENVGFLVSVFFTRTVIG